MSKFLPAVCAFGLLSSSVLAQEKSLEQLDQEGDRIWGTEGLQKYQFTRIVPSGANQRIQFITALNPDCTVSGAVTPPGHKSLCAIIGADLQSRALPIAKQNRNWP